MSGTWSQDGGSATERRPCSASRASVSLPSSAEDSLAALNLSQTPSRHRSANACCNYELMPEVATEEVASQSVVQGPDDCRLSDHTQPPGIVLKPLPLTHSDAGVGRAGGARKFARFWRFLTKKRGHSRGAECEGVVEEAGASSCLCGGLKRSCHLKAACAQMDHSDALLASADHGSRADVGAATAAVPSRIVDAGADDIFVEMSWSTRVEAGDVEQRCGSPSLAAGGQQACRAPVDLPPSTALHSDSPGSSPLDDSPTSPLQGLQQGLPLLHRGASTASSSSSSSSVASFGATGTAALSVIGSPAFIFLPTRADDRPRGDTLDRGRLVSTTTYPSGSMRGGGGSGGGGVTDESVPALVPRTIHTQIDYVHCLVPELQRIAACAYYWGVMDRYEAERALDGRPEGTFLLRDSAQDDFLFSVSFRRYGRSLHARVEQWNHRFSFDSHDATVFSSPSVCALVEHYKDPASCLFFEPLLTAPLPRTAPFSLQALCRTAVCATTTYDGISALPLPAALKAYLQYYHYKQKVRVRRFEAPPPPPMRPMPTRPLPSIPGATTP